MESISLTSGMEANALSSPDRIDGVMVSLPDVSGLECLPASGTITFKFKRDDIRLSRTSKLSAVLILTDIEDVKCDEEGEAEPLQDKLDELFDAANKEDSDEKKE